MIGQYSKSEWAVVGNSGVIVGLPGRNQSHPEIGGSIKGDVNKKTSPSAGSREVFCLDIQPTVC
jgi:hypothetical protein